MGEYKQDLKTILTLLAAGLDPMSGISMYQDALTGKRERADEREQTEKYLVSDVMPTLQSGADWDQAKATLNTLGDAYGVGENALKNTKQDILQDFYGGDRQGENVFAETGEEDLGWDETDDALIQQLTEQGAQLGYGRAEIRERLTAKMRERFGEEVYKKYAPMIHQGIDTYWPNYGTEVPGGATPEVDNWLKPFDGGAPSTPSAQSPTTTPSPSSDPLLDPAAAWSGGVWGDIDLTNGLRSLKNLGGAWGF